MVITISGEAPTGRYGVISAGVVRHPTRMEENVVITISGEAPAGRYGVILAGVVEIQRGWGVRLFQF